MRETESGSLLRKLLAEYLDGRIGTELFCDNFEHAFNFEVNRRDLTHLEAQVFQDLFDEVVWFTPAPPEEWDYPHFRSEDEIRTVAGVAFGKLTIEAAK